MTNISRIVRGAATTAAGRRARIRGGFGAAVGATVVVMLVMAIMRLSTGTLSIPELIQRDLLTLFGDRAELFFADMFGIDGPVLLLVTVVEATLLLYVLLGWTFPRIWPFRGGSSTRRWLSGLLYGLLIGLLYNVVLLPQSLAGTTTYNSAGTYISAYAPNPASFALPAWLNVFLLNILFGLVLVWLLPRPRRASNPEVTGTGGDTSLMSRRDFTTYLAGGALTVAAGVPLWLALKSAPAQNSLLARAVRAANTVGWRRLGALNGALPSGANFRESDILYNPDDRMYYVFSTEGDGNSPPPTTIDSSTAATPTTISAPGHRLKVGMQVSISGHRNNSDEKSSKLNNRGARLYYRVSAVGAGGDPNTFQVVSFDDNAPVGSTGGYGGLLHYMPDPHIAMRRASTPEGITLAGGEDYVEYVSSGVWYPTVVKEGSLDSSVWHLWGTHTARSIAHTILDGAHPGHKATWSRGVIVGAPLLLGDISVRRNPVDGFWYAVGLYNGSSTDMRIFRTADIASGDAWQLVGSVFPQGRPSWATGATPDPNICFLDGRAYVLFTGRKEVDKWNTGIVEVDLATGRAIGPAEILLKYGAYPAWARSVLSDLVFVPAGHDGVDRIFAFGSVPYYSGQHAVWGCLDLNV